MTLTKKKSYLFSKFSLSAYKFKFDYKKLELGFTIVLH